MGTIQRRGRSINKRGEHQLCVPQRRGQTVCASLILYGQRPALPLISNDTRAAYSYIVCCRKARQRVIHFSESSAAEVYIYTYTCEIRVPLEKKKLFIVERHFFIVFFFYFYYFYGFLL